MYGSIWLFTFHIVEGTFKIENSYIDKNVLYI